MKDETVKLYGDYTEGEINALAFNIGKLLDHVVNTEVKNRITTEVNLEEKILSFRTELVEVLQYNDPANLISRFDEHFGITRVKAEIPEKF